MLLSSLQASAICFVVWIFWKAIRPYVVKSSLSNVRGPQPQSLWRGHLPELNSRHSWGFHDMLAEEYGGVSKLTGMFGQDALFMYDPKALHHIILNDQQNFFIRTPFIVAFIKLVFGEGLLSTLGETHRKQRKMLTPVFSIAHLRGMTPLFYDTAHRLRDGICNQLNAMPKDEPQVDVLQWMGRTALELIGQGGLGYSFDRLVSATQDSFGDALKLLLPTASECLTFRMLAHYHEKFGPPRFRRFLLNLIPSRPLHKMRDIVDTLSVTSKKLVDGKVAALKAGDETLKQQVGEGKDIMSILLKANLQSSKDDKLTDAEVLAQVSTLMFAATDTTSNALARTLDLLVCYPDVQEKLRAELIETSNAAGGDIPYDQLVDLPFLDAVCRETLRLHSPVPFAHRECVQDTILPLSAPIVDVNGALIHEVLVPKGTYVIVGIEACNKNKAIWGEDALEWKPERWLAPLPDAVKEARVPGVYANLMTFLGGGNSCIGFKFSQLEMKVILAVLISSFKFSSAGANIVWNMASVTYPTVGPVSAKPSLPLKVEVLA